MRTTISLLSAAILLLVAVEGEVGIALAAGATETADLLIQLLKAERTVVSDSQGLINDSSKGDKGFTPEVFASRVMEKFMQATGADAAKLADPTQRRLVLALLDAGREVIAEYQPVINKQGIGFKGVLPAKIARLTGERFLHKTGVQLKLTAADYRYPGNKPDEFEAQVLKMFADPRYPKGQDYTQTVKLNGQKALRVMSPEYATASCLQCHGQPKGERDITGGRKEGWKEGDFGGAISVVMPMK